MDELAEVIVDNADDVVEIIEVVRNNVPVLIGVFAGGIALGAGVGYFVTAKQLTKRFEAELEREIEQTREFFFQLNKVDEDGGALSPKDVLIQRHGQDAADAVDAIMEYQGRPLSDVPELEETPYDREVDEAQLEKIETTLQFREGPSVDPVESVNVFTDDTFNLEEEKQYRTEDRPYIITRDEFFEADKNYDDTSLTYFEVDDVLVDERSKPIEDVENIIGIDHLVRFGSGSLEKNTVYIRNDKLETDYEVTRSTGSYLEEVLGIPNEPDDTLKHSAQRDRRRAFRHGDD